MILIYQVVQPGIYDGTAQTFILWQFLSVLSGWLLIAPLAMPGALTRLVSHPWLVFGGEISYSMYMLHVPIIVFMLGHPELAGTSVARQLPSVVLALLLLSCLLFLAVEKPARTAVRARLRHWDAGPAPQLRRAPAARSGDTA